MMPLTEVIHFYCHSLNPIGLTVETALNFSTPWLFSTTKIPPFWLSPVDAVMFAGVPGIESGPFKVNDRHLAVV